LVTSLRRNALFQKDAFSYVPSLAQDIDKAHFRVQTTKDHPTAARIMGGMAEKGKDYVINLVNPKLKSFDKPLMLSVLIGSITLIGVVALTMRMLVQCDTATAMAQAHMDSFKEREMKSAGYRCILDTKYMGIRANPCLDQAKPEAGYTYMDKLGAETAFCFVNYMVECTVRGKYQTMDLGMEDAYCDDSPLSGKAQGDTMELDSDGNVGRVLEHCAYQNLQTDWVLAEKLVVVTYRTCPGFEATLGSALGYSAYFEFVATLIFITMLFKCGVIQTSNVGNLSQILQKVIDTEELKAASDPRDLQDVVG
jgi:hypothetical protein